MTGDYQAQFFRLEKEDGLSANLTTSTEAGLDRVILP
jgi:hypothetical protein